MKEEIKKELSSLKSSLADNAAKREFKVPEGYFESMQDEVLQKLEGSTHKVKKPKKLWAYVYATAAILAVLIGVLIVFDQSSTDHSDFETLSDESIYTYLDENLEDISIQELIAEATVDEAIIQDDDEIELLEEYLENNLDDISIETLEQLL